MLKLISTLTLSFSPSALSLTFSLPAMAKGVMLLNRIGPTESELYVARADGTEKRPLTDSHWESAMLCFVPKARASMASGNRTGAAPVLDLPLKILVWEDAQGKVWVTYNSPVLKLNLVGGLVMPGVSLLCIRICVPDRYVRDGKHRAS